MLSAATKQIPNRHASAIPRLFKVIDILLFSDHHFPTPTCPLHFFIHSFIHSSLWLSHFLSSTQPNSIVAISGPSYRTLHHYIISPRLSCDDCAFPYLPQMDSYSRRFPRTEPHSPFSPIGTGGGIVFKNGKIHYQFFMISYSSK